MKQHAIPLLLTAAITISGCVAPVRPEFPITAPFDAAQAKSLLADGRNTIRGSAFIRQNGGGVVTCAGSTVYLIPATEYANQRFMALYGRGDSGYNARRLNYRFVPDDPEYHALAKTTKCDAQGKFEFTNVADGRFFVATLVHWAVGYAEQGGWLMHKANPSGGITSEIILTP